MATYDCVHLVFPEQLFMEYVLLSLDDSVEDKVPQVSLEYVVLNTKSVGVGGGGVPLTEIFINKVWDTQVIGDNKWHTWKTENAPDISGSSYDGPGTWGVDTSNYTLVGSYTVEG